MAAEIFNKEFLESIKAVDTQPRPIYGNAPVQMRCHNGCDAIGTKSMTDLRKTIKLYGFAYKCDPCRKAGMYAARSSPEFAAAVSAGKKGKPQSERVKEAKRAKKNIGDIEKYWTFQPDVDFFKIGVADEVIGTCKECKASISKQLKKFIEAQDHSSHGCPTCWQTYTHTARYADLMGSRSAVAGSEPRQRQSASLRDFWAAADDQYRMDHGAKSLAYWNSLTETEKLGKIMGWRRAWGEWRRQLPDNYYTVNNFWNIFPQEVVNEAKRIHGLRAKKWWSTRTYEQLLALRRSIREGLERSREQNPDGFTTSAPQQEMLDWVRNDLGLYAKTIWRKDSEGRGRECDIYIPELNIGIEYNGLYWHSEALKNGPDKYYHRDKSQLYREFGIRIIHIFAHTWKDNKRQVKSFLRAALKKNKHTVGVRECEYRALTKEEANRFCAEYHVQGKTNNADFNVGLYYKDDLVSVACFGSHHRGGLDNCLKRFVCKDGWSVSGALSKFSMEASKYYNTDIISWADLLVSEGTGYLAAGWVVEARLKPGYFYYNNKKNKVVSKQSRKKSLMKTPDGMTEHEHALQDGLFRVYDCGKLRLRYNKAP